MKPLVFIGAGHTHLGTIKALKKRQQLPKSTVLISASRFQYYSGMIPSWVAGHYSLEDCCIDVTTFCQRMGIQFIQTAVYDINVQKQAVIYEGGRQAYGLLSIDVGSSSRELDQAANFSIQTIKPLSLFVQSLSATSARGSEAQHPMIKQVIGGGAGGFELVMAIACRDRSRSTRWVVNDRGLLPMFAHALRQKAFKQLQEKGIECSHTPQSQPSLLAIGAKAHPWQSKTHLKTCKDGYFLVDKNHQCVGQANVFAVGDCATRQDISLAKSGVHAVRQIPVLANNLHQVLTQTPFGLRAYHPKARQLYLLSCGDQYALGSWGNISFSGRWVWHWKKWLDTRYVRQFSARQ
ncbi:MAG: hypothetical protein SVC26_02635 [Pseudomonadota bacterium]|nr:hypothetical protein [Pseudomonadota bacterium]